LAKLLRGDRSFTGVLDRVVPVVSDGAREFAQQVVRERSGNCRLESQQRPRRKQVQPCVQTYWTRRTAMPSNRLNWRDLLERATGIEPV
jgi:hypothetical protein